MRLTGEKRKRTKDKNDDSEYHAPRKKQCLMTHEKRSIPYDFCKNYVRRNQKFNYFELFQGVEFRDFDLPKVVIGDAQIHLYIIPSKHVKGNVIVPIPSIYERNQKRASIKSSLLFNRLETKVTNRVGRSYFSSASVYELWDKIQNAKCENRLKRSSQLRFRKNVNLDKIVRCYFQLSLEFENFAFINNTPIVVTFNRDVFHLSPLNDIVKWVFLDEPNNDEDNNNNDDDTNFVGFGKEINNNNNNTNSVGSGNENNNNLVVGLVPVVPGYLIENEQRLVMLSPMVVNKNYQTMETPIRTKHHDIDLLTPPSQPFIKNLYDLTNKLNMRDKKQKDYNSLNNEKAKNVRLNLLGKIGGIIGGSKESKEKIFKDFMEKEGVDLIEVEVPQKDDSKLRRKVIEARKKTTNRKTRRLLTGLLNHYPYRKLKKEGYDGGTDLFFKSRNDELEPFKKKKKHAQERIAPLVADYMEDDSHTRNLQRNKGGKQAVAILSPLSRLAKKFNCAVNTLKEHLKDQYPQVVKGCRNCRLTDYCRHCHMYHLKVRQLEMLEKHYENLTKPESYINARNKLMKIINVLLLHRRLAKIQRGQFLKEWESVPVDKILFMFDFKENIKLGKGKVETGQSYYNAAQRMIHGVVVKFRDENGNIVVKKYIIKSYLLNKNAIIAKKSLDKVMCRIFSEYTFLKEKKTFQCFCDHGPHYFCQEFLAWYFVDVSEKFSVNTIISYFVECHGKGEVDSLFRFLDDWLESARNKGFVWNDEQLTEAINIESDNSGVDVEVIDLTIQDFTPKEVREKVYLELENMSYYYWFARFRNDMVDDEEKVRVKCAVHSGTDGIEVDDVPLKLKYRRDFRFKVGPGEFKINVDKISENLLNCSIKRQEILAKLNEDKLVQEIDRKDFSADMLLKPNEEEKEREDNIEYFKNALSEFHEFVADETLLFQDDESDDEDENGKLVELVPQEDIYGVSDSPVDLGSDDVYGSLFGLDNGVEIRDKEESDDDEDSNDNEDSDEVGIFEKEDSKDSDGSGIFGNDESEDEDLDFVDIFADLSPILLQDAETANFTEYFDDGSSRKVIYGNEGVQDLESENIVETPNTENEKPEIEGGNNRITIDDDDDDDEESITNEELDNNVAKKITEYYRKKKLLELQKKMLELQKRGQSRRRKKIRKEGVNVVDFSEFFVEKEELLKEKDFIPSIITGSLEIKSCEIEEKMDKWFSYFGRWEFRNVARMNLMVHRVKYLSDPSDASEENSEPKKISALLFSTRDMYSIAPGNWTSDNIVDFGLVMIKLNYQKEISDKKILIGCVNDYEKISYNSGLLEFIQRRSVFMEDFFEKEIFLFPVNIRNTHWVLFLLIKSHDEMEDGKRRLKYSFQVLDSLSYSHRIIISNFKKMLRLVRDKNNETSKVQVELKFSDIVKRILVPGGSPKQNDSDSCGLFVVRNSESIVKKGLTKIGRISKNQMKDYRRKMYYSILRREKLF